MADVITLPGSEQARLVIDRDGCRFVLKVVDRPPVKGLPKFSADLIALVSDSFLVGLTNKLPITVTFDALVGMMERPK